MDEYLKTNQETWDTWTRYHLGSKFYDIEGFKAGSRYCTCNATLGWIRSNGPVAEPS